MLISRKQTERGVFMNVFKIIFVLLFIWVSVYTISVIIYDFRTHSYFAAINAILLQITAVLLCSLYVFV